MYKIRHVIIALGMLLYPVTSPAQVSIGIGLPNVNIGINLPAFPQLVVVPGYPVYYAPQLEANYFFYDGMYWLYEDDSWYASSWYNGPWWFMGPEVVPVFVLRIPVRYYRRPPVYFHGWRHDAPPRWGHHWGRDWEQHRGGWDRWERHAVPAPAPLPVYQRQYSKDRYPRQAEQQQIQEKNYRYQPRDPVVQQYYKEQAAPRGPAQQGKPRQEKQGMPAERGSGQPNVPRSEPRMQGGPVAPRAQPPQRGGGDVQRSVPDSPPQRRPEAQDHRRPPQPGLDRREQQTPGSQGREENQQGGGATHAPKRRQGQEQEQEREQERGRDLRE